MKTVKEFSLLMDIPQTDAGLVLQDLYHYALALAELMGISTEHESVFNMGQEPEYSATDLAKYLRKWGLRGRSYRELATNAISAIEEVASLRGVDPYTSHTLPQRVEVYWNVRTCLWSVRALSGPNKGRVIAHLSEINLRDCTFAVQPAGRERVRREKRKNVHAFVRGTIVADVGMTFPCRSVEVSYNPYMDEQFREISTNEHIYKADAVCLSNKQGYRDDVLTRFPRCTALDAVTVTF